MIRDVGENQLPLPEFGVPFATQLDPENRWVKQSQVMPWDELGAAYYSSLSPTQGRPAKPARLAVGAVIIKHKKGLSDEETVAEIQESPYLQFFCGLKEFTTKQPFAPSLFVEIRRRMGADVFERFQQAIIDKVDELEDRASAKKAPAKKASATDAGDDKDGKAGVKAKALDDACTKEAGAEERDKSEEAGAGEERPANKGKLIVDATVSEQMIRYPTDLSLLNEAREISEGIIDVLHAAGPLDKKPRTYRKKARKDYLAVAKQRRPGAKKLHKAIGRQLRYLRRNFKHIEVLIDALPEDVAFPLKHRQQQKLWVIKQLYTQQEEMGRTKTKRCDDRIVSIHQPHVRPIVRGKLSKPVEFGAKLSVSMDRHGLAHVDRLGWDAFNEGGDLKDQIEAYKKRYGHYPEMVLADPLYGSRENRKFCKEKGIRFAGKPLGRPKKKTAENQASLKAETERRREDYRQRIPIEGKFGQGKNGYGLAKIRARTKDTSESWIRSIFFVMNLVVLYNSFLLCLNLLVRPALSRSDRPVPALERLHRFASVVGQSLKNAPLTAAPASI